MGSSSHITMTLLFAFVVASSFFTPSSAARSFDVGGEDGWVVKPSESYDHWARRLRFSVNDSIVFKYKQGSNSVVQVKKEGYESCSTSKRLKIMRSGTSVFKFTESGPFFFISGNQKQCLAGQKLVVVVLAVRSTPATPPPMSSSAPALPPSSAAGTPKLAPQPSAGPSPSPSNAPWISPAGAPSAPWNSPGPADRASPPEASKNSSSSAAAIGSPALVAVGLGLFALFM